MTAPDALHILIDLAKRTSDTRLRALAVALGREKSETERLHLLLDYRTKYRERLETQQREGITPAMLANYRQVLGRLDAALQQQEGVVAQRTGESSRARVDLNEAERKHLSYQTVSERRAAIARVSAERREQKQHDEMASRGRRARTGFARPPAR